MMHCNGLINSTSLRLLFFCSAGQPGRMIEIPLITIISNSGGTWKAFSLRVRTCSWGEANADGSHARKGFSSNWATSTQRQQLRPEKSRARKFNRIRALRCKRTSLFLMSFLAKSPTLAFALFTVGLPVAWFNTVRLPVRERKEAWLQTAPRVSALQTLMPPVPTLLEPHLSHFISSLFVSVGKAL